MTIPFNRPHPTGKELTYIAEAIRGGALSGDGPFTKKCHAWLREKTGAKGALLTHSCTAALEMGALLAELGPGDEAILPSFTFVSTANAIVLRGATPVFVDVRPDTLNLDETLLEAAVTPKTKAIFPVHYAGVGAEMDVVMDVARRHSLFVVEDAAQGVDALYKGRPLGTIGDVGCLSFHETKNVISGEGGALLIRDEARMLRSEILREKGTNRASFFRGQVDKYSWVDVGSSYLPSEIVAAFLLAQLESTAEIQGERVAVWQRYWDAFAAAEAEGVLRRPIIPAHCKHNAHMFYVLAPSLAARTAAIAALKEKGFQAVFHYVPLHSAPAGKRYGRTAGPMTVTDDISDRLVRLPLWVGLPPAAVDGISEIVIRTFRAHR